LGGRKDNWPIKSVPPVRGGSLLEQLEVKDPRGNELTQEKAVKQIQ